MAGGGGQGESKRLNGGEIIVIRDDVEKKCALASGKIRRIEDDTSIGVHIS